MVKLSGFKSPQGEMEYRAAYGAVLQGWPVPYEEHDVPTHFGTTHVIASGRLGAPPLVLLHATGMSATVWFPNVGELSQAFRTYCVDIMNEAGKSVQTQLLKGGGDCAVWLRETIDALEIDEPLNIVGSSFGGWLTLNLALRDARSLSKIVLLAPAAALLPLSLPSQLLLKLMPYLPFTPSPRSVLHYFFGTFAVDPNFARQFSLGVKHFRYADPRQSVFPTFYTDDELRSITTPALLLIGDKEVTYDGPAALARAKRLMPKLEAEMVANAGHILAMEQPAEVNRRTLQFLQT